MGKVRKLLSIEKDGKIKRIKVYWEHDRSFQVKNDCPHNFEYSKDDIWPCKLLLNHKGEHHAERLRPNWLQTDFCGHENCNHLMIMHDNDGRCSIDGCKHAKHHKKKKRVPREE